jgi:hypothetical protein
MGFPKKIKKHLPLQPKKILSERREELLDYIRNDGTYLPKSVLHADLDRGMLDFVKDELQISASGKNVPVVDIIITTQNWSQFTQTWNFQDLDNNVSPPFITVVRQPEVKYGSIPSLQYTIPNRKQFYYASVPTWDGQRNGMDIYKIPQPVPVDITFSVKIICNRMRELNSFNKTVLQKFSSRQAYTFIKGHYVPIIMDNISDESVMDIDKRKFYIQSYNFTMMGFLIDEEEFEVSPAISRVLTVMEMDTELKRGGKTKFPPNPDEFEIDIPYAVGTTSFTQNYYFTADLTYVSSNNVSSYDIYINGDYYGTDLELIQLTSGDVLVINITKDDASLESSLKLQAKLL